MALLGAGAALAGDAGWVEATRTDGVVIYNRERPGSEIKEVLATGSFDAPLDAVRAVLDDLGHYKDFMPYTKESREILKDKDGSVVTYERIAAPLSSERDYTIRVTHKTGTHDGKTVVTHTFSLEKALGPKPVDGVVRLQVLEGHWRLEADGKRTKASYYVYTSPGGSIPSFVANMANNTAVPGLFNAVKKRLAAARR